MRRLMRMSGVAVGVYMTVGGALMTAYRRAWQLARRDASVRRPPPRRGSSSG